MPGLPVEDLVNSCCWDWVRHCLTQKCTVLSGANDRPARPVGDAATTNHERDLDDQRGAVLGSADRDVHRFTADPAAVNQRDLVGRAYRWRCIDYLRLCYRAAVLQSIVV